MSGQPLRTGKEATGKERQRSRTGCSLCRSRKIKCDETPGGCRNCERLDLLCPNSPSYHDAAQKRGRIDSGPAGPSVVRTEAGFRRTRTYRSCKSCRASKARCSGQRPVCLRCKSRGLDCSYDGKEAPDWVDAISAISVAPTPRQPAVSNPSPPWAAGITSSHNMALPVEPRPAVDDSDEDESDQTASSDEEGSITADLSWLLSLDLPEQREHIVALVEEYFLNIHSLRCLGFIHKPSFMQQLGDRMRSNLSDDALLHTICALGAKFFALRHATEDMLEDGFALSAGNQWAKQAQHLLFANLNRVSVEKTMAAVLLHEYELRVGNYASAFMLTGLGVRMAQALQLNVESPPDVQGLKFGSAITASSASPTSRESHRRLAWSVWAMDAYSSSDVPGHPLLDDGDMRIQMPSNDAGTVIQPAPVTDTPRQGLAGLAMDLPFILPQSRSEEPCLQAQFIRLTSIRKRALKYAKQVDETQTSSLPGSELALLESALSNWHDGLPPSLRFSPSAVAMRKESLQLGSLFLLHITYHQTLCDLGRAVAMPDLFKTPSDGFPETRTPSDFVGRMQSLCFEHATAVASIFKESLRHGPDALADPWLCAVAHDSSRIIARYVTSGMGRPADFGWTKQRATTSLHSNLLALEKMVPIHSLARELHESVTAIVAESGLAVNSSAGASPAAPTASPPAGVNFRNPLFPVQPAQAVPTSGPWTLFSLVRRDVEEAANQAPEGSFTTGVYSFTSHQRRGSLPGERIFQVLQLNESSGIDGDDNLVGANEFDDVQSYLPQMLDNFSLPSQGDLGGGSTDAGGSTGAWIPIIITAANATRLSKM